MRSLSVALALSLALGPLAARAEGPDAGAPPPGRRVELEACPAPDGGVPDGGCRIPFAGSLLDKPRAAHVVARIEAAEQLAASKTLEAQDERAKREEADRRVAAAQSRPTWSVVFAVGAGCLVAGVAGGVALVYAARK